jgi:hypothetical protein
VLHVGLRSLFSRSSPAVRVTAAVCLCAPARSTVIVVILLGILRRYLAHHVDGKVQEMRALRRQRTVVADEEERLVGAGRAAGTAPSSAAAPVPLTSKACVTVAAHILVGHALGFTIAYLNMLIAMTFNVGLFICVIVGETIGYMAFASGLWFQHPGADPQEALCH